MNPILPAAVAAALTLLPGPTRPEAEERPWTLLIYGAADNNADGPILHFLDGVRAALDDDPGMELILFLDRSEGYSSDAESLGEDFHGARIYRLRKDSAELLDATDYFPDMKPGTDHELDSSNPENLAAFIAFGKERFPAERYGLMIYSHADGCTMCPDEHDGGSMAIPAVNEWVGRKQSVDFLALELCNMAGVEIAYQWRPGNGSFSADVLVAIPNAGPPLDWDRAFARIRSEGHAGAEGVECVDPADLDAVGFGRLIVEEGYRGRKAVAKAHPDHADRVAYESAGCFDLRAAEKVKRAVDEFAVALAATDSKDVLEGLRDGGEDGPVMNYVRGQFYSRAYVDLYDLCRRAAECAELSEAARAAARKACEATDEMVLASFGMEQLRGFEPGKHGIFITFPDGDAEVTGRFGKNRVWAEAGWYTPLANDGDVGPYGRWSFLADGATPGNGRVENWFELLDSWFDTDEEGGGSNGYRW